MPKLTDATWLIVSFIHSDQAKANRMRKPEIKRSVLIVFGAVPVNQAKSQSVLLWIVHYGVVGKGGSTERQKSFLWQEMAI